MCRRKIIDMHAHIFPQKIAAKAVQSICDFYDKPMYAAGTVEGLLKQCRIHGIRRVLVHSTATRAMQVQSINEYIIAEVQQHNELIGFGTLHPGYPDIQGEIRRMTGAGLQGVKLHPDFQQFYIDDPGIFHLYEACAEAGLPVLIHAGDYRQEYSRPGRLAKVVEKYPDLQIIAAHFGGWSVWEEAYAVLQPWKNLYFDTSSSLYELDKSFVHRFFHKFGTDQIFFGTDYPMWNAGEEITKVLELGLSEKENEKIFYQNAVKFLSLDTNYS